MDTSIAQSSGISTINLTRNRIIQLKKLGIVWGIVKYFHPALKDGKLNCDSVFFAWLDTMLSSDISATDSLLSVFIQNLEHRSVPTSGNLLDTAILSLPSNWDSSVSNLFSPIVINTIEKLNTNYQYLDGNRYVKLNSDVGNPEFTNENSYPSIQCPDAGFRQLALFRYWNMIQYYYPYRYMLTDWNKVLDKYIPIFNRANTQYLYVKACMELIAEIGDTHASVFGSKTIDSLKGILICPFQTKYIDSKLLVTRTYSRNSNKINLKIGDEIKSIDNVTPRKFIDLYSKYISSSNKNANLKILFSSAGYALRSNSNVANIVFLRSGKIIKSQIRRIPLQEISPREDWTEQVSKGLQSINDSIGYIYPELLKKSDYNRLVKDFSKKKGLIIDLRCYPSVFLPSFLCTWLNCDTTAFAIVKCITKDHPGKLNIGKKAYVTSTELPPNNRFEGKLAIIVNSSTISLGEYSALALSNRKNTVIVGSQTAGADGDVSLIELPGGIKTLISGTAVYSSNGKETQKIGIVPQIYVEEKVKSVSNGVDNQFNAALHFLINK